MATDERRGWRYVEWQVALDACASLPEITALLATLPLMDDPENEHDIADQTLVHAIRLLARWMNQGDEAEALMGAYDAIDKWYG